MIIVLSPAKTLDETPVNIDTATLPRMLDKSEKLVSTLAKKSSKDLQSLMKVSEKIADLNVERFQNFHTPFTSENAKPSLLAFRGDVYTGLAVDDFSKSDFDFAQGHLRILSGLYGLLKPMDLMQPYRLEMGTRLSIGKKKTLYEYWGDEITKLINEDLQKSDSDILLNLASQEYFKSVKTDKINGRILHIDFKENRNGKLKTIAFNAKKARGNMARQIVKNQITKVEELKELEVEGYVYNEKGSTEDVYLFVK